jgi:hypothetical protein
MVTVCHQRRIEPLWRKICTNNSDILVKKVTSGSGTFIPDPGPTLAKKSSGSDFIRIHNTGKQVNPRSVSALLSKQRYHRFLILPGLCTTIVFVRRQYKVTVSVVVNVKKFPVSDTTGIQQSLSSTAEWFTDCGLSACPAAKLEGHF